MSSGHQLANHLNSIGARDLSFRQAAGFGVELVHHFDSDNHQVFHTADGDVVHRNADSDEDWQVVVAGRNGARVRSGHMERIHDPSEWVFDDNIHPTAQVDPSALIEHGALIGPHSVVGKHTHIGVDTHIGSYTRVEDGAFVGPFSAVLDGSRVGPGAVVGTGSRIGPTTNIGAGARLEQYTEVGAFDNVAAQSRVGSSSLRDRAARLRRPGQITQLVDRLASLDRG